MVVLRVEPSLRLFLRARHRSDGRLEVAHDPDATVGHVVESAGVPLPEVGRLVVAGRPVPARWRPGADDVVDVLPPARPQPLDGAPLLLLDVHLGTLARRLRLLGVDAAYDRSSSDDELVARAAAEDRLLLTQDRGLLRRRALRRAAYVRGSRPDDQLADVLDRFRLPLAPWTRCTACGGGLEDVAKPEVAAGLAPGTRRTVDRFRRCARCGQVYWRGAHAARLAQVVQRHARG